MLGIIYIIDISQLFEIQMQNIVLINFLRATVDTVSLNMFNNYD